MERRSSIRMETKAQCRVYSPRMKAGSGVGVLTNVSRSGAMFRWPERGSVPAAGDLCTIELAMPAHGQFDQRRMCCRGEVVRVSGDEEGNWLVALRFNRVRFERMTA